MDPIKFLDTIGLVTFWEKIKTFVKDYTYGKDDVWNKEETYNKDQINDLIGAPHFIGTLAAIDKLNDENKDLKSKIDALEERLLKLESLLER